MNVVFVTMSDTAASLMAASLREFGGPLADSPVWAFGSGKAGGAELFPMPDSGGFPFSGKVAACARAEELASGKYDTMIWIDPECLVVNPPVLYALEPPFRAAFRPVHIRNVGLPWGAVPDAYWSRVFRVAGEPDFPVESFVDGQRLRAYFNTHAFSVDPGIGLMGRWKAAFGELARDRDFTSGPCSDELHKVFLHQAVLSALAGSELGEKGIRILPPGYNYPYNLQEKVPAGKRAVSMEDLVTVAWEGRSLDPEDMADIAVREPLRSWLASRAGRNR